MVTALGTPMRNVDTPPVGALLCPQFSATGGLLPGSVDRPDMVIRTAMIPGHSRIGTEICTFNKLGYLPLVSTITGLARALLGIIHTIVHLACAIFDKISTMGSGYSSPHFQEAVLGGKNIIRGIVEAIPIVGNLAMFLLDAKRSGDFRDMEYMRLFGAQNHEEASLNEEAALVVSAYGQEIARSPAANAPRTLEATSEDFNRIIAAANIIFG